MTENTILFSSAETLASLIATGKLSSEQVVRIFLKQIKTHNATYNAIVSLRAEDALAEAREADRLLSQGMGKGVLHGVPITIKDTLATQGLRTTVGHEAYAEYIPTQDAAIVELIKKSGAIILGKTNVPRLALDMQTENPVFGRTLNPWNTAHTTGGSSGGCATALAAGMTPLSLGSDMAGSIRQPAAFCGVYGFKPTEGTVSRVGHMPPLPDKKTHGVRTLNVMGPLARNISDLELALRIIASPSGTDRTIAPLSPAPLVAKTKKEIKIAYMPQFGEVYVSKEVTACFERYIKQLREQGFSVEMAQPEGFNYDEIWSTWGQIVGMMGSYEVPNSIRQVASLLSKSKTRDIPTIRHLVSPISIEGYMRAMQLRDDYTNKLENFLQTYDVWITPVASTLAFKHHNPSRRMRNFNIYDNPLIVDGKEINYWVANQSFTTVFNFTGSPVVSIPVGMGESSLPFGVQIAGSRFNDYELLQIAKQLDIYAPLLQYPLSDQNE